MDWETDLELKAIRQEFLISLEGRLRELSSLRKAISSWKVEGTFPKNLLSSIYILIHKLAGSSGSYGFSTVGRISGLLDDLLSSGGVPQASQEKLNEWIMLLEYALESVIRDSHDPLFCLEDPRMHSLTSYVESLPDSASF